MADTLFGNAGDQLAIDPDKDYFTDLVGEGKKYKDPVAAGRALVEKDAHITKVEQENAALRDEVNKRKTTQELIDQITAANRKPDPTPNNQQEDDPALTPSVQPKVEDVVRDALDKAEKARAASANRKKVIDVLRANYGNGWETVLKTKLEQLDVGQKFVDDLAGTSPAAVFQLLSVSETVQRNPNPAQAARANPGTINSRGVKNFAYFEQLRLANRDKVLSTPQMQEAIKEATAQGDDFYA